MGDMNPYDVFCSYSWRERTAVEAVAQVLQRRGLRVFLDRWYLMPGRPWPQALEEILASCRAVAVFVGPQALGPWQLREAYLALNRKDRHRRHSRPAPRRRTGPGFFVPEYLGGPAPGAG